MKKIMEFDFDDIKHLMVEELKDYYQLCAFPNKVGCSDEIIVPGYGLLKSIDRVLQEYMTVYEYEQWQVQLELNDDEKVN
jgi:hypothetical protein